jgi:endonuclease YncB( thermonuclease family)
MKVSIPPRKWTIRRILPISIWCIVGLAVLGLVVSDAGLRSRLFGGSTTSAGARPGDGQRSRNKIDARVVTVLDGESFTATDSAKNEIHVRLAGVDAPKPDDYFGEQARENLVGLIRDKSVTVEELKTDAGGALIARVSVDGQNVNLEQLKGGYAWISGNASEFLTSGELENYRETEVAARSGKVGLWTRWDVVVNSDSAAPSEPNGGLTSESSENGVFSFASGVRPENVARTTTETRASFAGMGRVAVPNANPYDADSAAVASSQSRTDSTGAKADSGSDCKPEVTAVVLKSPEPQDQAPEVKPAPRPTSDSGRNFIMGPRGGCFYVTPSGGKKYVDRGLCGQTVAVGGRQ